MQKNNLRLILFLGIIQIGAVGGRNDFGHLSLPRYSRWRTDEARNLLRPSAWLM